MPKKNSGGNHILKANSRVGSLKFWQGIMKVKDELVHNFCWFIGNGENIDIQEDSWIATINFKESDGSRPLNNTIRKVAYMINAKSITWNTSIVKSMFT